MLNYLGKPGEALVALDKAISLSLRDQSVQSVQGIAYTLLGRSLEAISALKPYLAHHPDNFWDHAYMAVDYMELGHEDWARAEVAEVLRLDPEFSVEMMFPTVSLQSKVLKLDRLRGDLRKAGLK